MLGIVRAGSGELKQVRLSAPIVLKDTEDKFIFKLVLCSSSLSCLLLSVLLIENSGGAA